MTLDLMPKHSLSAPLEMPKDATSSNANTLYWTMLHKHDRYFSACLMPHSTYALSVNGGVNGNIIVSFDASHK